MSAPNLKQPTYKMTPGIFQVESILQRGRSGNQVFYLVKWKGYSEEEATWEPESNLSGCKEAILQFQSIIKKLEEQKSIPKAVSSEQTKRKTKRQKQRKFLTSQSKELSNEEELLKQTLPKLNQNQDLRGSRVRHKKQQKKEPQKLETQLKKNQQHYQSSSSHQNHILESTTAQTIQPIVNQNTDKRTATIERLLEKKLKNSFEKSGSSGNQKNTKATQIKFRNQLRLQISREETKRQLKRSREQESVQKRDEKITKRNKKQTELSNDSRYNKLNVTCNKEQLSTNPQENSLKNKETELQLKLQANINHVKTQPVTLSNENLINQRHKIKALSQRSLLCDEQFKDLVLEMIGCFDQRFKIHSKFEQEVRPVEQIRSVTKKFIDLSSCQFSQTHQKISKIILKKDQVEKLDSQGEFLYCDIEALIKLKGLEKDVLKYQWISVLKNHEANVSGEKRESYFVRIDDMKSQTWKKKFRKFLMPKI